MKLFPVYPLFDIELVKGKGANVYDSNGQEYLDLYGGHAVISVGHGHKAYKKAIKKQLGQLAYYSNSVKLPIQDKLAKKLGKVSGYKDYSLFLCNSGAEAIENALKIASFQTKKRIIITFEGGFHGRTSGAVAVTDNKKIQALVNPSEHVVTIPFNNINVLRGALNAYENEIAAVIIEPIQGVNGIQVADISYLIELEQLCKEAGILLIADEVQAGYARTGEFFSHQHAGIKPHLITVAKGMGNGFPIGGVLIHPEIDAWAGMLGTTFGGNPLACAAALSVLNIMEDEELQKNATKLGDYLKNELQQLPKVKEVRGRGLMIGIEFDFPIKELREKLLYKHHILTGSAKQPNVLRILPPLNIKKKQLDQFLQALSKSLKNL
ncbi:MAG: aminotransferase class III-fold pyridoxal phosphate-dependent enzyme [Chitinophagales bacterium]